MINAPWAVIIFLKALNPYRKQEASSSDQQYKHLEITKYSVFSKIHRDLSKFKHSVLWNVNNYLKGSFFFFFFPGRIEGGLEDTLDFPKAARAENNLKIGVSVKLNLYKTLSLAEPNIFNGKTNPKYFVLLYYYQSGIVPLVQSWIRPMSLFNVDFLLSSQATWKSEMHTQHKYYCIYQCLHTGLRTVQILAFSLLPFLTTLLL